MAKIDPFTQKRLERTIRSIKEKTGAYPTIQDLEREGFTRELIKSAVHERILEQVYVNLTNGSVVKGFCVREKDFIDP